MYIYYIVHACKASTYCRLSMYIKFQKFLFLFLCGAVVALTSCTTQKNETAGHQTSTPSGNYAASLVPAGTLSFDIDERTNISNPCLHYFEQGGDRYLIYADNRGNRILFFDIDKRQTAFEVKFASSGTDGIGKLRGATVLSLDSIILLGSSREKIYLSDTSATIRRTYTLHPDTKNNRVPQIFYSITTCFKPTKEDIYFFSLPYGMGQAREYQALREPCIVHFDLSSGVWKFLDITFPEAYHQDGHYVMTHFEGDIDRNGDKLIISFPASNDIQVYEHGKVTKYQAKSDHIDRVRPPGDKMATTAEELFSRTLLSPTYFFMLYDPYREVYYRFLLGVQEDMTYVNDILRIYDEKPLSIIILDKEFRKIGEVQMPESTYHVPDHFVASEGLYLSMNNVENPILDEDKLTFGLLKLVIDNEE